MGDDLKKVQAGQPLRFPAGAYNAFIDAARDFQNRQRSVSSTSQPATRSSGIVLVRNDTAGYVDRFWALGIDEPIIDPVENENEFGSRVTVKGVVPVKGKHERRFVVLLEPLLAGKIGRGVVDGVTVAKVNMLRPADRCVEMMGGEMTLPQSRPGGGGAPLLWVAGGVGSAEATGPQWAVVRMGGSDNALRYGKLKTAWADGDATVTLTPCISETDGTASGEDDVTVKIYANFTTAAAPALLMANVGDILAYVTTGSGFVLFAPPAVLLPPGGYTYQVLQRNSAGKAVWDWLRAHT